MTLKKFLKHIDFCTDVEIYGKKEKLLYEGSIVPFQIKDKGSFNQYINECIEDKDFGSVHEAEVAWGLANRRLRTDEVGEAVGIKREINEHGVEKFILVIYTKGKKKESKLLNE